ncbi:MAG TPA: carbon storage regulator [Gemmataceae bacterium]|jgi:carbon storage regulator|nr:carbon storage regulator [Gemmataceae bacterium]
MLVVSRRIGEEILVPEQGIIFRILEIRGNKVRVGITAPPAIRVQRRELWERIQAGLTRARAVLPAEVVDLEVEPTANGVARRP